MSDTGIIFNIQRFSVHDGPGIRTTVFFKGCSLRCFWCHNPEGIRLQPEIQFYAERCIGDAECARVCPQHAHEFIGDLHRYHRELCQTCGKCVDICYANALELTGKPMTVEQVMAEIGRDQAFYATSGGGVTLSGGDPLMQRGFARALLAACKAAGLHTALETAANCRWQDLADLLPLTDLVMIDIKHLDADKHRQATGVSNERILANARQLAATGKPVLFRIPIVPTVNDSSEEVAAIARFVREITAQESANKQDADNGPILELLPFHRLAEQKYTSLGLDYQVRHLEAPDRQKMAQLAEVARAQGIAVRHR